MDFQFFVLNVSGLKISFQAQRVCTSFERIFLYNCFPPLQRMMLCYADGSSSASSVTATGSSVHAASNKASKLSSAEKKPKTIQDDPQATEVFKSLFNTHKTAKQQQQAHWVTYNPQYF